MDLWAQWPKWERCLFNGIGKHFPQIFRRRACPTIWRHETLFVIFMAGAITEKRDGFDPAALTATSPSETRKSSFATCNGVGCRGELELEHWV
ncbi:hypothetical protein [Rhizobium sp. SG_E_25_P2]|uniref:hypothetical protein n=1 Tax=Rhizobium sp. SG_E_25_P2 TaxID=2879942 RepID=UPI00247315FD|nr:hypothetical protein [Rhizobium sp. SG_E_25_P2]